MVSKKNRVLLKNNSILIHCTEFELAKKNLVEWLKLEAKKYLVARVHFISSKIKISFKSITLKSYRAMWGACNSRSEIYLNWKLVMLPKKVIDYVIVHELCHIVEPNHSKSFWIPNSFNCPSKYFTLAELYLLEKDTIKAIENYQFSLSLDPPSAFVYLRIAECFMMLKKTNLELKYYKLYLYQHPKTLRWGSK